MADFNQKIHTHDLFYQTMFQFLNNILCLEQERRVLNQLLRKILVEAKIPTIVGYPVLTRNKWANLC